MNNTNPTTWPKPITILVLMLGSLLAQASAQADPDAINDITNLDWDFLQPYITHAASAFVVAFIAQVTEQFNKDEKFFGAAIQSARAGIVSIVVLFLLFASQKFVGFHMSFPIEIFSSGIVGLLGADYWKNKIKQSASNAIQTVLSHNKPETEKHE